MFSSAITTYRTSSQLTIRLKGIPFHRTITAESNGSDTKLEANLKSWREIPGPTALPIIGQALHYFPGGELSKFPGVNETEKLFDKYGPMVRLNGLFGKDPVILLGNAELAAHVLRSENRLPVRPPIASLEYYRKKHRQRKGYDRNYINGFNESGELWKEIRSIANPVMLQPKTVKLYCNVMDEVAMDMIKRIKVIRDEKNMLPNFHHEMNLWALESIATVALGCRLNGLDYNLPVNSPQSQLIQCLHEFFYIVYELDFKPNLWKYISTPLFKKAMKLYKHLDGLIEYFIWQGIAQLKENTGPKSDHEKGVLEKLLDINEEVAHKMATDMLLGGVHSASSGVTAILYLLGTHKNKQEKLRDEILSKPIDQRPYLKACIKEGMRLLPVGSSNIRRTTREYNFMGYKIPKDMNVIFAHREMSLMEQHYPRAREFIPERWIAKKGDPLFYGDAHPFAYSPFGFGVRSCIGRRFAELEIETFLSRFIENFDVEWCGPPPKIASTLLNYFKGPFYFILNDIK